jgi:MFS family permease
VDRQLIPSLAPKLIADLHLSHADIGLLYGYVFLTFYVVMGMFLGTVADRWHRPRLMAAGIAIWSLMTALSGAATSFAGLAMARMLVGVGEATLTPAALSLLGDRFPNDKRAFAAGFYYSGVPLGVGASMIVSGWLVPLYGWRACFWILGVAGLLMAPLVLLIPDRKIADTPTVSKPQLPLSDIARLLIRSLRATPAAWLTILGGALINYAVSAAIHVLTWMTQDRGVPFQTAAYLNGAIYTIAGMLGTFLGGWVSDWFHRRYTAGRLWFLIVKACVFLPVTLAFNLAPFNYTWYLGIWFLSSFGSTMWYGPVFATVQDLLPAQIRGTAVAFLLLIINLLGSGPGPWITGLLGDRYGLQTALLSAICVGFASTVPFYLATRSYSKAKATTV